MGKATCDERDDERGVTSLVTAVSALRDNLLNYSRQHGEDIAHVHPANRRSAENLLHYLALREDDVRELQVLLASEGLSSLGRSEAHVRASVEAVLGALHALAGDEPRARSTESDGGWLTFAEGQRLLTAHTDALLGPPPPGRTTRIMVTLPSAAAVDYPLVRILAERGMDCARVNCAHDDEATWAKMIANVRKAAADVGRPCLVAMDLAGPKLRTGPLAPGPEVVRLRPTRDVSGQVTQPAACWFATTDVTATAAATAGGGRDRVGDGAGVPTVPVPGAFLGALRAGDRIRVCDARGAHRLLRVTRTTPGSARAETDQTTYLATGSTLHVSRGEQVLSAAAGRLPAVEQSLRLRVGDHLVLVPSLSPAPVPSDGGTARIGCTPPDVFGAVRAGHRVWFDDGKIGAVVTAAGPDEVTVRITAAPSGGKRLRGGKSVNLPDTRLPIPALTTKDETDLRFVAAHADIVSLSFVRRRQDLERLQSLLVALGRPDIGIILKIETLRGFENLPRLLLAGMRSGRTGVMIARGDLAVECGYDRLAELQEEILWLCEAAHVPVVWATQVLDQLARTGRPSRAEITDVAMSERAECVMLNKGPFIADAVTLLADVLGRMEAHQRKKVSLMRRLRSWRGEP